MNARALIASAVLSLPILANCIFAMEVGDRGRVAFPFRNSRSDTQPLSASMVIFMNIMAIIVCLTLAVHAETPALDSEFDREFEPNFNGVFVLCEAAHIACGIVLDEEVPFDGKVLPIPVEPKTVRGALDSLVKRYPSYRWDNDDGVVIIRPRVLIRAVNKKLLLSPVSMKVADEESLDVCLTILQRVNVRTDFFWSGMAVNYGYVSAVLDKRSVISALAEIARKDGQMMWVLSFRRGLLSTNYHFSATTWRQRPENDPRKRSAK